tara:strand:+ start:3260 stop:3691 length:432 start_codon:yes stop_codon:yes gene_type:complete
MNMSKKFSTLVLIGALLSACAINKKIEPVTQTGIESVCIKQNPAVTMDAFEPLLQRLIEEQGIKTDVYAGEKPAGCRVNVEYTARWRWDLAMYLFYAQIRVFDQSGQIGLAEYDAMMGGANLGKFGTTEEKVTPLVRQLFARR